MSTGTSPQVIIDGQHHQAPTPARRPRGRWIWALSGVTVLLLFGGSLTLLIGKAGIGSQGPWVPPTTHAITITQPVTSISVQSYGSDIHVVGGGTSHVQVTETIYYDAGQGQAPDVTDAVSGGRLTLAAPACAQMDCSVGFTLRVPATVSVLAAASGGNIVVSDVAGASLDSGGGDVTATSVSGTLTAQSEGGNQYLAGIDGALAVESGGGDVVLQGLTAPAAGIITDGGNLTAMGMAVPSATLTSGGGDARVGFSTPPDSVIVSTDGGNATVLVPGGPYALTADSGGGPPGSGGVAPYSDGDPGVISSGGGPVVVGIATSPTARATLAVTTGGGSLVIEPGTGGPAPRPAAAATSRDLHAVPTVPRVPRAPRAPRPPAISRSAP